MSHTLAPACLDSSAIVDGLRAPTVARVQHTAVLAQVRFTAEYLEPGRPRHTPVAVLPAYVTLQQTQVVLGARNAGGDAGAGGARVV